jgi:hypothetical protein
MGPRTAAVVVVVLAASVAGGCGSSTNDKAISGGDAPAFTTPTTRVPYENGGGDGSGADGAAASNPRGGVGAGPDSPNPGEADSQYVPPANEGQGP